MERFLLMSYYRALRAMRALASATAWSTCALAEVKAASAACSHFTSHLKQRKRRFGAPIEQTYSTFLLGFKFVFFFFTIPLLSVFCFACFLRRQSKQKTEIV